MLSWVRPGLATSTWGLAVVYPAILLGTLVIRRTRIASLDTGVIDELGHVASACSLAAMSTIATASLLGVHHAIQVLLPLWLSTLAAFCTTRIVFCTFERRARRSGALTRSTLIVGAGVVGEHIARRLLERPEYGLRPVGFLDADPLCSAEEAPVPVLGGPDELAEVAERTGARHVIVAFSCEPDDRLVELTQRCQRLGLGVSLVPRLYESINERATLDHIGGMPVLGLSTVDPNGWQFAIKHGLDRAASLLALLVLSPVLLAIAAVVRLGSPGPVIFRQRRIGRDGHEFEIYKFRTMREQLPGQQFTLADGVAPGGVEGIDRRTRAGRVLRATSADELPQLLNVLRGEMSLVGPRPERPEYAARFARELNRYDDRHRVKSGLTGWAQVNGLRGQTSIADRVEWDNHYIQNWSLGLELRTLMLTVAEVLRFRESRQLAPERAPRSVRAEDRDASLTVGPRLTVTAISAGARRLLGIDEADAIGRPIVELFESADVQAPGFADLGSEIAGAAMEGGEVVGTIVRPRGTHGLRLQTRIVPGSSRSQTLVMLESAIDHRQPVAQAANRSDSSSSRSGAVVSTLRSAAGRN